MSLFKKDAPRGHATPPKYPGVPSALDGSGAIVEMETAAGDAAGAYPITPSTQMGEGFAAAMAAGTPNVNGRRLIFFEPEGEHAAAAVTAGMSMTGLRATNFSSGQGIAYMHESLYAAVGKRLTYVLNMACRAMTKHALNVHCGHDDYHAVDDTGFFQVFAKDVQESADLNLIAHRLAELALNPGICAQDGFLTSHVIESMRLPERDLVREYLGDASDLIESPTPAQRMVFGERRRRIPEMFDFDDPAMLGVVQNQDSYAQGVAAQRPFYFDHVAALADRAFAEYAALTGRAYARASGYRIDDAEWVLAGQGSVVANAEAVCDHLRKTRGWKVGVLNLTMFRPFPADLVGAMLRGKKGVVVLERTDQPLAVDPPLLREIRAALSQALENGRARGAVPHPGIPAYAQEDVPEFYSACFGLGSRDLQPADLVAAVENMREGGRKRRRAYLGIDFVRQGTRLPKLQIWQERLLDAYPNLPDLALEPSADANLLPEGSTALRIHSVGGWGAITMGKNLALTVYELLGMHVKANPKYGSEKKGQPTTFYAVFAKEPVRLNCELKHVDVVLSPDPKVFRTSDPLAGLAKGGAFVIQCDTSPEEFWRSLPGAARRAIRERGIRVFLLDAFAIARAEASDVELQFRLQGAAFLGAFFRATGLAQAGGLAERSGLDDARLFEGIRAQIRRKFGKLGDRVVEDNVRVVRRGHDETKALDVAAMTDPAVEAGTTPRTPKGAADGAKRPALADPGRFWEQVCSLCAVGQDPIADPFAAISAIPAATGAFRDMTGIRHEVPDFVASRCTGCGQCWVQCPDAAIPGLVSEVEDVLAAATSEPAGKVSFERLPPLVKPLSAEARRLVKSGPFTTFADALTTAYGNVASKLNLDGERRARLDVEFAALRGVLADFPLAKTGPFFDGPEAKQKGTGGLLSVTVNPAACKGCNLCVDVCPEHALVTVKQDDRVVDRLRRNWELWERLPDTKDRYLNVPDLEEGVGVLSTLLLKKGTYRSMVGGDGACMGCGEKTSVHLVTTAVRAVMTSRVEKHVARLADLSERLDAKARALLSASADLDAAGRAPGGAVAVPVAPATKERLARIARVLAELKDLRWRYVEGPSGKGRAHMGIANSTGCSSVWAGTYPYNPYPFPWVNHLFQDAPSVAIGVFEGHMRKMADGFAAVRRAEIELQDAWDPAVHGPFFAAFDWKAFDDVEFGLCPPIFAVGGDGAMLDIGFQNLSRLLASGKPIRVLVLDTQVYSNTGGQACTSGYTGQVSDMAAYGPAQHGKQEVRKELGLLAIAHRGAYVLQSSQASPSHLLAGVIKGLRSRRPAIFNLYTPCPVEHGLADDAAARAARLALESRAFPFLAYDPDGGDAFADCLSLEGNPALDDPWPTYELSHEDDAGGKATITLPLTIADWAATESRFGKHFKKAPKATWSDEMVPFHAFLDLGADEREGKIPFVHVLGDGTKGGERRLGRLVVSKEIAALARERLHFWSQLRQLAGLKVAPSVEEGIRAKVASEFDARLAALTAEHEAKVAELRSRWPQVIAQRMAEGILSLSDGSPALAEALSRLPAPKNGSAVAPLAAPAAKVESAPAAAPEAEAAQDVAQDVAVDPYIESARCTSCNECINLNKRMFAYNASKQATVKDPRAGTFQQLVVAAERCPVSIIHPGTPLDPKEKDLAKWVKRAERFR